MGRLIDFGATLAVLSAVPGGAAPAPRAAKPAASATGPIAVPRATFIAAMDGEFSKIDADHNKILTRKEADAYEAARVAAAVDQRRRALFAALDADHNGALTEQEFARLELPVSQGNSAPLFAQNDLNRDGQITLVEYRTAKLANFDRMDADKDGVVSPAEMKAAGLVK